MFVIFLGIKKTILARLHGINQFLTTKYSHYLVQLQEELTHEYFKILKQEEDL